MYTPVLQFLRRRSVIRLLQPRWKYLLSRATAPLSPIVGIDRGRPIDRYFIDRFIESNRARIRGRVLEVKDLEYTTRFGHGVEKADILDVNRENKAATVIDDIRSLSSIPDGNYDCFIVTQVLQYVDDLAAAARAIHRVLRPGGAALITLPTLGKLDGHEDNVAGHYWRFTPDSARYIFSPHFQGDGLRIDWWGNARVGMSFLAGMAIEDLTQREFDVRDPNYVCGVTVLAVR